MTKMTKKDLAEITKKYLKTKGNFCPFCGSKDVEGIGATDCDGDYAWNDITCNSCEKTWSDEYKLSGIVLHDE